ncbi:succinate dehydrogenase hydrophobic membrane anchor subunit [Arthrobacter sp. SA17]
MSATEIQTPRSGKNGGQISGKPAAGVVAPQYRRTGGSRGNFEMFAWLFMRLSGVVLVVLIFGHLFVNLLVGEGIKAVDFGFVAGKWADPFWQVWDLAMLWLAMLHGTNGVRTIINDYAEKDSTRFWLKMVLYAATTVIIILGTLVIFTFNPCPMIDGVPLQGGFCPAV